MVALAPRRALIEETLPLKGPRGAVEALMRYLNDDGVFAAIPPDVLERMLDNADTILTIEAPATDDRAIGKAQRSDHAHRRRSHSAGLQRGDELVGEAAQDRTAVCARSPGFYYYHPQVLADVLRLTLKRSGAT